MHEVEHVFFARDAEAACVGGEVVEGGAAGARIHLFELFVEFFNVLCRHAGVLRYARHVLLHFGELGNIGRSLIH